MAINLFGYEFKRVEPEYLKKDPISNGAISFVDSQSESTAALLSSSFTSGMFLDFQGNIKAEADLVTKYRDMTINAEIDNAVEEIVNEAITVEDDYMVKINLDDVNILDEKAKGILEEKHKEVLDLLDYDSKASTIFRRWYVDGRLYYHAVIDTKNPQDGIKELRYVDPRKIREIKEVTTKKINGSADMNNNALAVQTKIDYYLYNERGFGGKVPYVTGFQGAVAAGIKVSKDSVVHVPSGITDVNNTLGLGYLNKAVKILSQLKTMEDSLIIYRLARAPERRVWYVDVGNLPKAKAEQYVRDVMVNQKNKLVYDAGSGEIQDTRKFLCFSLDTKIPLLDGRTLELQELINEYQDGKLNWVYSCDPITGKFVPGPVSWAGITKKNSEVVKITFDNGKSITCTPDHKFPVWGEGLVEARNLFGKSVIPGYRRKEKINKNTKEYEQVYLNDEQRWEFTHRLVSRWKEEQSLHNEFTYMDRDETKSMVHHVDFDRFNNSPENLVRMGRKDHIKYHSDNIKDSVHNVKYLLTKEFYEERSLNEVWKQKLSDNAKSRKSHTIKSWKIRKPDGSEIIIDNLSEFCRNHDLNRSNIKGPFGSRKYFAEKLYNHKCIKVEILPDNMDVGCITVDLEETYHSNHTYLLDAGVYTKNTMLEDYWIPRRADGSGTRVDTLAGGKTLGEIEDIVYFQKLLYNSLNVPIERLQTDSPFQVGNVGEISRAEIKFNKFINKLKKQFSLLFRETLKKHVVLQGLMSIEEFESIEKKIKYDFAQDNHFSELKDNLILEKRNEAFVGLQQTGLIGTYFSHKWVRKNVFHQTDQDIEEMTMEIMAEADDPLYQQQPPEIQQDQDMQDQENQAQEDQNAHDAQMQQQQNDHEASQGEVERSQKQAETILKALKEIPKERRTPNDNKKLRSLAHTLGNQHKSS